MPFFMNKLQVFLIEITVFKLYGPVEKHLIFRDVESVNRQNVGIPIKQ